MKLSKQRGPYDTHPSIYFELLMDGKCFCTTKHKERGEEILKRWNEYETLKTKIYGLELENIALRGAESAAVQEINRLKGEID